MVSEIAEIVGLRSFLPGTVNTAPVGLPRTNKKFLDIVTILLCISITISVYMPLVTLAHRQGAQARWGGGLRHKRGLGNFLREH